MGIEEEEVIEVVEIEVEPVEVSEVGAAVEKR